MTSGKRDADHRLRRESGGVIRLGVTEEWCRGKILLGFDLGQRNEQWVGDKQWDWGTEGSPHSR